MPILVYYNTAWNGPATVTGVDQVANTEQVTASGLGAAIPVEQITVLTASQLTALKSSVIETQITVVADAGTPKGNARALFNVDVAASPSAYDISQAVWAQQLAGFSQVGSAGKALTDAGSAGNPWASELTANNTPGTFGAFIQKLLSLAKFIGLK